MKNSTIVNVTAQSDVSLGELVRIALSKGCTVRIYEEGGNEYCVITGDAHDQIVYIPSEDDDDGNLGQPSISHATGTARQNICDHLWYLREIAKHHGIGHLALDGDPVSIDSCLAGIGEALNSINDSVSNWK